jgi:DNA-binding beta-propeller fold protein YncE
VRNSTTRSKPWGSPSHEGHDSQRQHVCWKKSLRGYPLGKFPRGIAFDKTNIWVTDYGDNKVTKLRATDGMVLGAYNVGRDPGEITFDGSNIWVTNYGIENLMKLNPANGAMVGTYTLAGHANP